MTPAPPASCRSAASPITTVTAGHLSPITACCRACLMAAGRKILSSKTTACHSWSVRTAGSMRGSYPGPRAPCNRVPPGSGHTRITLPP
jgi:hypothetical protein